MIDNQNYDLKARDGHFNQNIYRSMFFKVLF